MIVLSGDIIKSFGERTFKSSNGEIKTARSYVIKYIEHGRERKLVFNAIDGTTLPINVGESVNVVIELDAYENEESGKWFNRVFAKTVIPKNWKIVEVGVVPSVHQAATTHKQYDAQAEGEEREQGNQEHRATRIVKHYQNSVNRDQQEPLDDGRVVSPSDFNY